MRDAMASAPVGDDVYGEDPTINSLEERVAQLFGKEAALFCPSGSLANQLSIRMLVNPGEELITETNSHIVRAELGAGAVFSGITTRTWLANRGLLSAEDPLNIARPDSGPYLVSTTAIAVENTHNFGGGTVQPLNEIKKLREESEKLGIFLHLDGARIWNAHIASGVDFKEYGKHFDTVSVCLSKGMGAPVGSLMLSTKDRVLKARQWRKRWRSANGNVCRRRGGMDRRADRKPRRRGLVRGVLLRRTDAGHRVGGRDGASLGRGWSKTPAVARAARGSELCGGVFARRSHPRDRGPRPCRADVGHGHVGGAAGTLWP